VTTFPATHCPDCGTALDERRIDGRDRRYCPACDRVVWHTPVPAATVAVVGDRGVLVTERAIDPGRGEWAVPGGHMEAGETPTESAARELREEAGLRADSDALRVVGTHSPSFDSGKHMVVLDYAVSHREVSGTPEPRAEVSRVEWRRPDEADSESFYPNHESIVRAAWNLLGDRR
jgi:8-oxo-dGTP pyrophosphatase MutT (NUDIX family)